MNFEPSFFTSDIITNIVYSSYIQDYFIFFALLLSGYIALDYFLGFLIGKIPYVNKLFKFKKFLSFLVILPLLIILIKIILNIDSSSIFLEKFLFITIFSSLSTLLFIYAGTKGLFKNDYGLIRFYKDYTIAIAIVILSSFYYYKTQANNNLNTVSEAIKNNIHKEMMYLQNTNDVDYRLSELIVNYYVKSIDNYTNRLERQEKKIINNFDKKIIDYDNKYIELTEKITNSNKLIANLELTYKNKIKIVDKEIDEEKLRLKSIYEEWKNNVVTNIDNLDKLSKQYKLEIEALNNNKDLITHIQDELKLVKQKNSKLNIELLKINDLISSNNDNINLQTKEISKIKTIQIQLNKNKKSIDLIKAEVDRINKLAIEKEKQDLAEEDNNSTVKKGL